MKKTKLNKLSLDRETLVSLQSDTLDNVNGGNGTIATVSLTITILTRRSCLPNCVSDAGAGK